MTRRLVLLTLAAIVCAALAFTAAAQSAVLLRAQASTPGIVGSWMVTISPAGAPRIRELHTYTADGAVIDAGGAQITNSPETETGSPGLGRWKSLGGNRFRERVISLSLNAHRHFAGTFIARDTLSVSGDTFTATSSWTFRDKDGKGVLQGTSTITGMRIRA